MSPEGSASRSDRVNICATRHEIYKQLTEGPSAPFKTMKDLFLTAAAIGVRRGVSKPIERRVSGGIFAWSVFTPQEDVPLLHALTLSLGVSLETLLDNRKILDIIEEYANGAMHELEHDLLATANPSLALVNKMLDEELATGE